MLYNYFHHAGLFSWHPTLMSLAVSGCPNTQSLAWYFSNVAPWVCSVRGIYVISAFYLLELVQHSFFASSG